MTISERIEWLKVIKEEIHVSWLDANLYEILKECALDETIHELEKKVKNAD